MILYTLSMEKHIILQSSNDYTRPKYQSSECNHVYTAPSNTQQDIKSRYPRHTFVNTFFTPIIHTQNNSLISPEVINSIIRYMIKSNCFYRPPLFTRELERFLRWEFTTVLTPFFAIVWCLCYILKNVAEIQRLVANISSKHP